MEVTRGVARPRGRLADLSVQLDGWALADEHARCLRSVERDGADSGARQASRRDRAREIEGDGGGDAGDREVSVALRNLEPCVTRSRGSGRNSDPDKKLVGGNARRERQQEKVTRRYDAAPPATDELELGAQGDGDGRQLGGRIRMGKASADRPTVADRDVTDEESRFGSERTGGADCRIALEHPLAHHRSESDLTALDLHTV